MDVEQEGRIVNIGKFFCQDSLLKSFSDISLNPEVPKNGKQFCVNVNVRNVTNEDIEVDVNSVLHSCFYTGKKHRFITQDVQKDQVIKGGFEIIACSTKFSILATIA